ncbi:MAG: tRNA(fMet)-specific endonuclease VapC [Methylobacteriaceae bacterium]|jgi:tRNA(fMet)-specific endonuclease VapC|nr:tRNA(fMet)-specific endonuclease VapC [Methylobacteriaceae bacterium]
MICLDTNAVIASINRRTPQVRSRLETALGQAGIIGIPTVVLFELRFGIAKSARPRENAAVLSAFLALDVIPWPFEAEDADEAGQIRAELERAGASIGPYDVLIAAQARRRNAVLVTANTREFMRVPDLNVEDWASA